jgi:hypothetical protein
MRYLCAFVAGAMLCCLAVAQSQAPPQPLKLVQKIPLPGVQGRIDHLSIDLKGKRLFIAALGNETVEIIDLAAGKPIHTIPGFKEPQAVLYIPESNLIFVADGEQNVCKIYDGTTYDLIHTESSLPDADNLRYDTGSAHTYGYGLVHVGYGSGTESGLRALDSRNGKPQFDVPLEGHPESFRFVSGSTKVFVNVPTAGHIAVVDTGKRRVMEKWPVQGFKPFYPMALDEKNQRLFIGSRNPPALVVFDMQSGRMVTSVEGVEHTDDLFFDEARKRLYMSGGDGFIGVFEQRDADHYQLLAKVPSVPGASTSLFVPEFSRLYVPATPYAGQPSQVLVYEAQP